MLESEENNHMENEINHIMRMAATQRSPTIQKQTFPVLPPLLARDQRRMSVQRIPFVPEQEMLRVERDIILDERSQCKETPRTYRPCETSRDKISNLIVKCTSTIKLTE